MSILPWLPGREDLLAQLQKTSELAQAGRNEEALEVARSVEAACVAAKVESSHVAWALAVLHDNSGNLNTALEYILKAVRLDPACPPVETSLGIIVRRARKKLVEGAMGADKGLALYHLLAEHGLADDACHVAYAKHLQESGDNEEALQVAQAVGLLNPGLAEAWRIVGAAAHALGNEQLASEASGRCKAARTDDGWNSVPRSAWGAA